MLRSPSDIHKRGFFMHPVLRLWEDVLSNDCRIELPAMARMIFVVHGSAAVDGKACSDGEAWHGEGAVTIESGKQGATCWRWEFAADGTGGGAPAGPGIASREKLSA